jgi:hypothetical protein
MARIGWKTRLKRAFPRLLKAAILSIAFYVMLAIVSSLLGPVEEFLPFYGPYTDLFAAAFIILLFASELLYGTVFQSLFGLARTFIFLIYLIYVLNGGILALSLPEYGEALNIVVDVRVFLTMLLFVLALGLAKNVLQTIDFLAKEETRGHGVEAVPSIETPGH